jgi:hypothetical protein
LWVIFIWRKFEVHFALNSAVEIKTMVKFPQKMVLLIGALALLASEYAP